MVVREEEIYVLFASQTGNSEQAARDICTQIQEKLSPKGIQKLTGRTDVEVSVTTKSMQLDDFLEFEPYAPWSRLIIICMSSYGVGQAPLGGYRFREFCDALVERRGCKGLLDGVTFALLGLGDSKYTTFFENPTKTNDALLLAGAKRVGVIGKADHSGDQIGAIEQWIAGIWKDLAQVLVTEPTPQDRLGEIQQGTIALCQEINPDFEGGTEESSGQSLLHLSFILPAIIAMVAFLIAFALMQINNQTQKV
mmetsp:Transcript_766/g.1059  ORF Transcript_766/g.1059 Transcript_766/m.1059 type:complete len:252 (-) Transcript_766:384-1139(-)